MSLLTPERVPVKVYKWDDVDAPILDKTAGCVATILKACLVTGYGDKEGAGWMLAHEDLVTNTKILAIDSASPVQLYLRIKNDTGSDVAVQVVKDVVDANTATVVAECSSVFRYLGGINTGHWVLIANQYGFWIGASVNSKYGTAAQSGVYCFAGQVAGTQDTAFLVKHTGGDWPNSVHERSSITGTNSKSAYADAVCVNTVDNAVSQGRLSFLFSGSSDDSAAAIAAPLYFKSPTDVYQLPVYAPSRNNLLNFDAVLGLRPALNFCTSTQLWDVNNTYVPTDYWSL